MLFFLDNLQISQLSVSLQCVFHSIRFKVNKGWSTAVLHFLCPYISAPLFSLRVIAFSYAGNENPGILIIFTEK